MSCLKVQVEWENCTSCDGKVRIPVWGRSQHKDLSGDIYYLQTKDEEVFVVIAPFKADISKEADFFDTYREILNNVEPNCEVDEDVLLPSFSVQRADRTTQFKGLAKGNVEEVVELSNVNVSAGRPTPGAIRKDDTQKKTIEVKMPCVFALLHTSFDGTLDAPLYLGIADSQ